MGKKLGKRRKRKIRRRILACSCFVLAIVGFVLFYPLFIELNGEKEISIPYNTEYIDAGAKSVFAKDQVKTVGSVDTSKVGTYTIKYKFFTQSVSRTVHVIDEISPKIELLGRETIYLTPGAHYTEFGAIAEDECDGDLTTKIQIDMSELNEEVPGTYHVSYTVKDSSGNPARVRRQVVVLSTSLLDMDMLEFTLNGYYDDVICQETPFEQEKYDNLLLFGDSFIEKLAEIGLVEYKATRFWSRPSTSTDDFYTRTLYVHGHAYEYNFFEAMDKYKPENVLILLNSDWTSRWTPEYLNESCDKAYAAIKEKYPTTNIIICSIMPCEDWYDMPERVEKNGYKRNDRINKMNVYMCELCRKYGFKFMNAAESVKNPETGACYAEYIYEPDGIHLSDEGCEVFLDYIKTHMDW